MNSASPTDPGIEREETNLGQTGKVEYWPTIPKSEPVEKLIALLIAATVRQSNIKGKLHTIEQIRVITTNPDLRKVPEQLIEFLDGALDDYEYKLKAELAALQPPQPASKEEHE